MPAIARARDRVFLAAAWRARTSFARRSAGSGTGGELADLRAALVEEREEVAGRRANRLVAAAMRRCSSSLASRYGSRSSRPRFDLDGYRSTSALMDTVGHDHGLILHAAAPTADGLLIVNRWPSKDGSEAAASGTRRHAALTTWASARGSSARSTMPASATSSSADASASPR